MWVKRPGGAHGYRVGSRSFVPCAFQNLLRQSALGLLSMMPMLLAAAGAADQEAYIERWKDEAIRQMVKHRIPASITLAQGILESGSGRANWSSKSNNHFGIKCHSDWTGGRTYYDDDKKGECFRVTRMRGTATKTTVSSLKRTGMPPCSICASTTTRMGQGVEAVWVCDQPDLRQGPD